MKSPMELIKRICESKGQSINDDSKSVDLTIRELVGFINEDRRETIELCKQAIDKVLIIE